MPTLSSSYIPKPKDWDEFEEITLSALKIKWASPNLTRHGRQGQKQDGIDIFGNDYLGFFVGVQCKNTIHQITEAIIKNEIQNAEGFQPSINTLFIATSADSCVKLQQYVRALSKTRIENGKFPIHIFFWNDLIQDIVTSPTQMGVHYPQININSPPELKDDRRQRDINQISNLLNWVDISRISYDIDRAPNSLHPNFLAVIDTLYMIRHESMFYLYNTVLLNSLDLFLSKWSEIACESQYIYNYINDNMLIFPTPGDFFRSDREEALFKKLEELYIEFRQYLNDFVKYIMESYPEIDLNITNKNARNNYREIEQSAQKSFKLNP